ncbi:hypothetical protein J537_2536 [Acinetobacter baumannii 1437282]|nr:hypothetical protein J537_2536 [Acinetobacter baumannii 1437282]
MISVVYIGSKIMEKGQVFVLFLCANLFILHYFCAMSESGWSDQ